MVEIREEAGAEPNAAGAGPSGDGPEPNQQPQQGGAQSAISFLKDRPVDAALWLLRLLTVVLSVMYVLGPGGAEKQVNHYSKTLMAAAATNALRLHQRLGGFQLSREFFASMFLEDSCHYLFYCIIFMNNYPVTMVLLPVVIFAILHAASFTLQLTNACGLSESMIHRGALTLTQQYAQNLLNVIACSEIFLFPMVVIMVFMGRTSILVPFIYYRFLTLRYMSRRNPNTRLAFRQLRVSLEASVDRPSCPPVLKNGVYKIIALVEKLCPQQPVA